MEERGETWDVSRYEEGLKVGTLVQVCFDPLTICEAERLTDGTPAERVEGDCASLGRVVRLTSARWQSFGCFVRCVRGIVRSDTSRCRCCNDSTLRPSHPPKDSRCQLLRTSLPRHTHRTRLLLLHCHAITIKWALVACGPLHRKIAAEQDFSLRTTQPLPTCRISSKSRSTGQHPAQFDLVELDVRSLGSSRSVGGQVASPATLADGRTLRRAALATWLPCS